MRRVPGKYQRSRRISAGPAFGPLKIVNDGAVQQNRNRLKTYTELIRITPFLARMFRRVYLDRS